MAPICLADVFFGVILFELFCLGWIVLVIGFLNNDEVV